MLTAACAFVALSTACESKDRSIPDGSVPATYDCLEGLDLDAGRELWRGFCEKHVDVGADGRVDDVATYEYDEEHRPTLFVLGEPPTGAQTRWTYDARGNLLFEEHDQGIDDTWDVIIERTYDGRDNILSETTDDDGDGAPNRRLLYSYDCFGTPEGTRPGPCTTEIDEGADETWDFVEERTYDDEGHLLTITQRVAGAEDASGTTTHAYDEDGNRIETTIDVGANGSIEQRTVRDYDDGGRILSERTDDEDDGAFETELTYRYDAQGGGRTREEMRERGELTYRFEYERDDRGLVTLETQTFTGSQEDDTELRRYHDTAGNPVLEVFMRSESSGPEICTRYDYSCFD